MRERIPPPTGVVSGPLMATSWVMIACSVSSGSQLSTWFFAFSPARTSTHAICRLPPYAAFTALSRTSFEARQMSGPMPSPSMNGMIGWEGTLSLPPTMVIDSPFTGAGVFWVEAVEVGAMRHSLSSGERGAEAVSSW